MPFSVHAVCFVSATREAPFTVSIPLPLPIVVICSYHSEHHKTRSKTSEDSLIAPYRDVFANQQIVV
ncbi:hypothetical protein K469DRAFT_704789 [Zopfia rhizophila CBS 207.26]|uniref:Uncharacterized protein n=1 Tax=Zopfia rhizophila CBS 207.26 TaxID=1314779 RepID=A0A6A6EBA1_9PEZI|nr:hypothetical protein K469DRAFT_704789 [Zopfia rhizophila CBS 207.26]